MSRTVRSMAVASPGARNTTLPEMKLGCESRRLLASPRLAWSWSRNFVRSTQMHWHASFPAAPPAAPSRIRGLARSLVGPPCVRSPCAGQALWRGTLAHPTRWRAGVPSRCVIHLAGFSVVALLATVSVHAQGREPPSLPDFAVADRLLPVDPDAGAPDTMVEWRGDPDRRGVYSTTTGFRPLHLDLYRQTGIATPRPLIVLVHGGGWAYSNPRAGAGFLDFPVGARQPCRARLRGGVDCLPPERGSALPRPARRPAGGNPLPARERGALRYRWSASRAVGDVASLVGRATGGAQRGQLCRRDVRAALRRLVRGVRHGHLFTRAIGRTTRMSGRSSAAGRVACAAEVRRPGEPDSLRGRDRPAGVAGPRPGRHELATVAI